ncbi:hypothetical protein ACFQ2K_27215 [Streptomyces sanglieri]|uniref:DUF7507 domain-containing protein n=2 Tax=Streptomyces TaxID=1883 RepID=A0ABW2WX62_9ACTN
MRLRVFPAPIRRRGQNRLGRWTAGGLGVLGLLAAGLGLPGQTAAAQPVGVPLVDETFTGADAIAGFEAFGPACLTGAPEAPAPGPGTHPLTGCPAGATGPVPPNDAAPHGYLRLTDASNDQSAAVLYNHALPANQGLVTTFDQWQYGGTTNPPADGISFFLIDGAASLTSPGAFGGSLGYAQKLPDDDPTPLTPGTEVPYEYVATNSGNTPLTNVNVTDDRVTGITCPKTTLAVGETMTCTGTYTVTAADATAGSVTNTATAHGRSGDTPVASPPDDVTLPVQSGPGVRLEKSADDTRVYRAGDEVTYTYTVTNTGSQELTGVSVTDDRVTGATCDVTTLAPAGQSGDSTTCTGTYRVTAADAGRGEVVNRAVATAENGTVRSNQDQARITVEKKPCEGKHCKPKPCHDKHDKKCKPKPKPKPCHGKSFCHA